jgi:hypothetical protein
LRLADGDRGRRNVPVQQRLGDDGYPGPERRDLLHFGQSGIQRDVWFTWVATANGAATMSTCGGTSVDTKIAAYAGAGCPASGALACNEDACSLQSTILFNVTSGSTYTLQLGTFPGASGGTGTFSLSVGPPPPPCGTNIGPDVIVGEIIDVLNANPVGAIDAIALGTTACNVGTAVLNWISNTNDHPVIRQNLYRYKQVDGAGRFEQVGMSWLKHGFAAAQTNACCTCTGNGDSQHLGVGCADPYGSGLNGSQPGLGPNWQVNAHTGFFTYPPANPTHGSDSIYRRCQVLLADLEATGGGSTTHFYGECQYVMKDDATAGNQNNNASWREATVSGSAANWTVGLSGSTHRGDPAIRAWAALDPAVNLDEMQIAGDGLVILGTRASALGGGTWRYEYCVYNMNADRNVGSISVPVPAGAAITNVGFHDVPYHDGDGPGNVTFSGTDWPGVVAGGTVSWACEPQAQNASANAIRWGTMYTFRFDADAAPVSGTITLGVWKAGSPPSITGTGDVPGGGSPIASFCFGDGTQGACPCANSGATGNGCENSASTGGAMLAATGNPSLAADTLVLTSSGERATALSIFLQGDAEVAPAFFGDGLRCAGGNLKRLYSRNAVGGSVTAPMGADPSVSARSAALGDPIPSFATRLYQVYYRDPSATFCPDPPGSTFNASNGLRVLWGP